MKKTLHFAAALLVVAPLVYLWFIWNNIPAETALHFDIKGQPDRYGSKNVFALWMGILSLINAAMYALMCNVYRIDAKKRAVENKGRMQKLAIAIALFIAAMQVWLISRAQQDTAPVLGSFIFIAMGLLFCIIGNYMNNIKPNYFAGLRLPWTLENEDNWRRTHHLASKIWFAGGLLIIIMGLLLPSETAFIVMFIIVMIMVAIPAVYSYRLFKKHNT
jgi:uncharacterized membrane protein